MPDAPATFIPDTPATFVPDEPAGAIPDVPVADIPQGSPSFPPTRAALAARQLGSDPSGAFSPFVPLGPDVKATTLPGKLLAAPYNVGKNLLEGVESRGGAAMVPLGLGGRLVQAGMGLGFGIPQVLGGLKRVYQYGAGVTDDPQEAIEGALQAGLGGAIAAGGLKGHSATPESTPEGFAPDAPTKVAETPSEAPEMSPEALRKLRSKVKTTLTKPFDAGQQAATSGKSVSDNPYVEGSSEESAWNRGFQEQAPPTAPTGEVPQQAPSEVAAKVGEVAPSPTEPAKAEGGTPEPVPQAPNVTPAVTEPISAGPGAASPGDVPLAPRIAEAAIDQPADRPFGRVSAVATGLNNAREAISNIGTTLKGIAGESLPKTTAADRAVGEAGVRYASSRIAAKPLARTFAAKALQGTDVDPIKFGAALTEDNLRSVREELRQKATEALADGNGVLYKSLTDQADKVATIIGSKKSPFQTENAYFDYLKQPEVQQAVKQHNQMWHEVIDPQFKQAMDIDPDTPLPSRGQQTGARVNLKAVFPEDPQANPIRGMVGSNLTGTFKKKTPFGIKARGTGETYDVNYNNLIQNTFERQLEIANKNKFDDMLVASGNAVIDRPGKQVMIGGKPAVGFPLSRKVIVATGKGEPQTFSRAMNIYVRQGLANEYEGAAGVGTKYRSSTIGKILNVVNRAALAGLTDATVHVSNQMTALFDRPLSGKLLTDSLLSATGRADVPVTVVRVISKALKDNQEQIAELSKIGAMRPQDIHYGVFGRALQATDRITRLALDDTFKGLVKSGLVENTETARREYVNQIGQYNRRLQGKWTRFFRDTGLGPFVTAGKTFNALGVRMATLDPGAPGANNFAAAALRANVLSKWVGGAVLLGTMNYLLTHKLKGGGMLGRPGTPVGNLDLGTNDKSGKQQSFPLFAVLGLGRGLRVTGLSGAINSKRLGLTNADAAEAASRDIINAWSAPFAGPPVKAASIAATGYSPAVDVGRTSRVVPPGQNQRLENIKEAGRQASPIIQTVIKAKEGKPLSDVLSSQIPRFTMSPGKTESMVEKYPKIVSLAQGAAFIDDMIHQARRLPKEERHKFVSEQILRLPPEQRTHARNEVVRRRVYTN